MDNRQEEKYFFTIFSSVWIWKRKQNLSPESTRRHALWLSVPEVWFPIVKFVWVWCLPSVVFSIWFLSKQRVESLCKWPVGSSYSLASSSKSTIQFRCCRLSCCSSRKNCVHTFVGCKSSDKNTTGPDPAMWRSLSLMLRHAIHVDWILFFPNGWVTKSGCPNLEWNEQWRDLFHTRISKFVHEMTNEEPLLFHRRISRFLHKIVVMCPTNHPCPNSHLLMCVLV